MSNLQNHLFDKLEGSRWSGDERYFSAYCPFESHRKPAILVYPDGWNCLSCGQTGSLKYLQKFLQKGIITFHKNASLKPILPRWSRWQRQYGDLDEIAFAAHRLAKESGLGYFKRRKIDKFFEQGQFGSLDGWFTFPVMDKNHEVVDIVVRAGKGKKDAGAKYVVCPSEKDERPLYVPNWERVLSSDVLYVVYGIITAWALEAIGLPVVTGITGKSLSADLLRDFHKPIIVVPDYDEEDAGAKLVNSLGWRGKLKLINYPENTTDADDIRRIHGDKTLMEALNGHK